MTPMRKILCAVDFSSQARAAVAAAADLAQRYDAALTLVHVFQLPATLMPEGMLLSAGMVGEHFQAVNGLLDDEKRDAERRGAKAVDTVLVDGIPWREIVVRAKEGGFDLIVVGTHGRTGIGHVLLGSVAERVVRHAHCPVFVVR